jgi:hypothetical protein
MVAQKNRAVLDENVIKNNLKSVFTSKICCWDGWVFSLKSSGFQQSSTSYPSIVITFFYNPGVQVRFFKPDL